jgi:hypothetical protein
MYKNLEKNIKEKQRKSYLTLENFVSHIFAYFAGMRAVTGYRL